MREPKDVIAELNSWENVAHELAKRGIKGERESCYACPVAVFLSSETGLTVDVTPGFAEFYGTAHPEGELFELDKAVTNFIHGFDAGEYPDLDGNPIDTEQDEY